MNFTIQNALVPTTSGYEAISLQIEQDLITAIGAQLDVIGTPIDGTNKLILPGLINAHTHSSEMWQRGLIPLYPLELWIAELHEFSPLEPEQVYWSAVATAIETLLSGGTCVVDHLVLIPGREMETIAAAIKGYQDVGIRAFIGPLIQDEVLGAGIPDGGVGRKHEDYYSTTTAILEIMEAAIKRFHAPDLGIQMMVAPTGIQLCSDALFKGCIELSDRYHLCRHAHLLETKAQQMLAQEKYGCSGVEYLHQIGYLNSQTSLAHCVWLDDRDITILAQTGATVVHNPLSNLRLGSGTAPILKYRQAGVNVAFGCDGASSSDGQDLLEAIKIGSFIHNPTEPDYRHWISPREGVKMASFGAAKGLGIEQQLGSLTVGKKADLVLYDLTNLSLLPRTDPLNLLIMGRANNVVDSVWVNGDRIVANGQPTRINLDTLRQKLFDLSQWRNPRQSQNIAKFENHYRQVMGLSE